MHGLFAVAAVAASLTANPSDVSVPIEGSDVDALSLSGASAVWSSGRLPGLYASRGPRAVLLWRPKPVPIPPDAAADMFYDSHVTQRIESIDASPTAVAFVHTAWLVQEPRCRRSIPACGVPTRVVLLLSEVWAGAPRGPFHRISRVARACPGRQPRPSAIAVAGSSVAFSEQLSTCELPMRRSSRIAIRPLRASRAVELVRSRSLVYPKLAAAGRYLSWFQTPEEWEQGPPESLGLVLFDVRSRRRAYRLGWRPLNSTAVPEFDVERDGVLALLKVVPSAGSSICGIVAGVGWTRAAKPRLRFIGFEAATGLRLARSRIVYMRWKQSCALQDRQLVFSDLQGRRRVLAGADSRRPSPVGNAFDFDGRRVAYVAPGEIRILRLR